MNDVCCSQCKKNNDINDHDTSYNFCEENFRIQQKTKS